MIITKEKEEKDANKSRNKKEEVRDQPFPKLILEEEKGGQDEQEEVSNQQDNISPREIILYFMFVIFFIVVTFYQLNIDKCYATNSVIRRALLEPSSGNLDINPNFINFEKINVEDSYWNWLDQLIRQLYNREYYPGFSIPESKQASVPNLNTVVSPLRVTQRRMKLQPITDPFTANIVTSGWASYGFNYLDDFDSSQEENQPFGNSSILNKFGRAQFNYTKETSFYNKGGYVLGIDLSNTTEEIAHNQISLLKDSGFIDSQTRSIVVDMVMFNSYTDLFTMVTFVATFEANGLLSNRLELYNLKWRYYNGVTGFTRALVEIAFIFLLIFYWLLELSNIFEEIKQQKKLQEKEDLKNMLRNKSKEDSYLRKQQTLKTENSACQRLIKYFTFAFKGLNEHYSNGWKWIDSAIIGLSTISILIWLSIIYQHMTKVTALNLSDLDDLSKNEAFFTVSFKMQGYIHLSAFNYVMLFVKLLRYLSSFIRRTRIIFRTLSAAQGDIFSFMLLYIIIFLAFSVMSHIYYGAELPQFASLPKSCATLFVMLMGKLDSLNDMIKMNETLSFFLFIIFITSMQFILMNMFIAFISFSYTEGINVNDDVQESLEEELKKRHWSVIIGRKYQTFIQFVKEKVLSKLPSSNQDEHEGASAGSPNSMVAEIGLTNRSEIKRNQKNEEESIESGDNNELKRETNLFGPTSERPKNKLTKTPSNSAISHSDINVEVLGKQDKQKQSESQLEQMEFDKNKPLLMRKIWDKQFDKNLFHADEPTWAPSLVSEKQEIEIHRQKEVRCGKILWAALGYTFYAALYISVIIMQIQVDLFYPYNLSLEENILDLQLSGGRTITQAQNYDDIVYWLQNQFPLIGQNKTLYKTSKKNVQGYFIRDVNYVINHQFRVCFILSKETGQKNKQSDSEYYKDSDESHYFKQDIIGQTSNKTYKFMWDIEGYQLSSSHCSIMRLFQQQNYNNDTTLQDFIDDRIISDQMQQLSIELLSFEASQYVHVLQTIEFKFPNNGGVKTKIDIFALSLNNYMNNQDYFRLGLEIIYLILFIYNVYVFVRKIQFSKNQYNLWYQMEVANLSDIEIKQRNLIKPEFFRKMSVIIDGFILIDFIYIVLTFSSLTIWIIYNQASYSADVYNTPITDAKVAADLISVGEIPPYVPPKNFYKEFYFLSALMQIHTNVAALNTIFISLRVFDYLRQAKSLRIIANTFSMAQQDIMYFIIIFLVLICGFVGMSYLSYGAQYGGYDTLLSSLRMNFQITLGEFDFDQLYRVNPTMTLFFFFPFNFLFDFILANIFLAIINHTYSESLRQASEQREYAAHGGTADDSDVDILHALFFCFKLKRKARAIESVGEGERQSDGTNGANSGGIGNDHLEVFEKLSLNLQQVNQANQIEQTSGFADIKTWAINCADEIKTELKVRSQLRHNARNLAMLVFNKNGGGGKDSDKKSGAGEDSVDSKNGQAVAQIIDDNEVIQRRIQYWDYLRNGTQFISMQNRTLQALITQKEAQIRQKAQEYETEKEKTRDMYKYLALLEKPIEDKLEQIMKYRKVLSLLAQEHHILNDQMKLIEQEKKNLTELNNHKTIKNQIARESTHSERRRQRLSRNRLNSGSERGNTLNNLSNANFTQQQHKLSHFI